MLAPADAGSMACDNEYTIKRGGNQQASKVLIIIFLGSFSIRTALPFHRHSLFYNNVTLS